MAYERLLDRGVVPDKILVQEMIGEEVFPLWETVADFLVCHFSAYSSEWVYYNPQHGWARRYRNDAHQLCMLFPERGAFTALVMLSPEEDAMALKKINYFNVRLREHLNRPSTIPHGRWLWMRLEDHTDFSGFKLLMDIKQV